MTSRKRSSLSSKLGSKRKSKLERTHPMRLEIEIGSEEWLSLRRTKITATDASAIMGVSPWTTPLQLYHKKIGCSETEKNEAMDRGNRLEPVARDRFMIDMNCSVSPGCFVWDANDMFMATLDGYNDDGVIVEIKCPGREDHETALSGHVPKKYYPQCQHQMMVMDADSMWYFSYNPSHEKTEARVCVERDEEYIESMLASEEEFISCLKEQKPPDRCDKDILKINDPGFILMERRLRDLMQQSEEIEEEIGYLRGALISECKEPRAEGGVFRFSKHETKGRVDYNKIPQLKGVDLDAFRRPSFQKWRLSVL